MVTTDQPRATENTGEPYHTKPHKLNRSSKQASKRAVCCRSSATMPMIIVNHNVAMMIVFTLCCGVLWYDMMMIWRRGVYGLKRLFLHAAYMRFRHPGASHPPCLPACLPSCLPACSPPLFFAHVNVKQ
eukprot:COSAG06_NODE_5294_length_3577_cov_3.642919_6_plen_129_part_00